MEDLLLLIDMLNQDILYTKSVLDTIKAHALNVVPEECCGLILKTCDNLIAYPSKNVSNLDKQHHFIIDCNTYLEASQLGNIVAFYHSENIPVRNTIFSENDIKNQKLHQLVSIIYNTCSGQFYCLSSSKNLNYLGLPFIIGKQDCFSLIRLYFKQELGIHINDYFRDSRWIIKQPQVWAENFQKENFIEVTNLKLQEYDVLLIDAYGKGFPTHGMIYVGKNMILHHPRNQFSTIEPLLPEMIQKTKIVVRHKSLWKN